MTSRHRSIPHIFLLASIILLQFAVSQQGPIPVHASDLAFNPAQNLSNDTFFSGAPKIAAVGSNAYVAWQNSTCDVCSADILFTASSDSGSTFLQPKNVKNLSKSMPSPHGDADQHQITALGNYVYVVWQDNLVSDVWFTISSNNGTSFGTPVNLSNDRFNSTLPEVAAAGSYVYVVWQNGLQGNCSPNLSCTDIFLRASNNNGIGFNSTVDITPSDKFATNPVITAAGNNVTVAWQDNSAGHNHDLLLKTSHSHGSDLATSVVQNLSHNPTTSVSSLDVRILAIGPDVYVAWIRDTIPLPDEPYFAASANGGTDFNTTIATVNLSPGSISYPSELAAVGSSVYVAWADRSTYSPSVVVTLKLSINNGRTFGNGIPLSNTTGFSPNPQLAAWGTNVYVAWQDTATPSGNGDVFFVSSGNSGASGSFGSIVNLTKDSNGQTLDPVGLAVAANGNQAYTAWQDDSQQVSPSGNPDIVFRTNLKPNFVLNALESGWNSTSLPGSTTPCSNSGCNPALGVAPLSLVVKDRAFVIQIVGKESLPQDIAIYTNGTTPGSVNPSDTCSLSNAVGCLAKSQSVTLGSTSVLVFSPTFPPNFTPTGPPFYEYYSQNNATSMHGRIYVHRTLDPDNDRTAKVDIIDIATVAFAFGSTPGNAKWNQAADLDNSGKVDILDVALIAIYFGKTF